MLKICEKKTKNYVFSLSISGREGGNVSGKKYFQTFVLSLLVPSFLVDAVGREIPIFSVLFPPVALEV